MPRGCGKAGALLVSLVDDDRTRMMLVEVAIDDPKVAGVRPEQQVKGVADERDGVNRDVEAQLADHPPELQIRHAQVERVPDKKGAHGRGVMCSTRRPQTAKGRGPA